MPQREERERRFIVYEGGPLAITESAGPEINGFIMAAARGMGMKCKPRSHCAECACMNYRQANSTAKEENANTHILYVHVVQGAPIRKMCFMHVKPEIYNLAGTKSH